MTAPGSVELIARALAISHGLKPELAHGEHLAGWVRDAQTALSAVSAAPDEMVENAAIALFTKHWQRKPDTRDFATGALDTYRVLATDVLASTGGGDGR